MTHIFKPVLATDADPETGIRYGYIVVGGTLTYDVPADWRASE